MGPSVPYTVVFLWISAAPASAPLPAQLDALRDYGAARGLAFVPLGSAPGRPTGGAGYDDRDAALVDRLEAELEQARTALSALEEQAAGQLLTRVEAELFAHPHLPQAAFLMAECLALQERAAEAEEEPYAAELRARRAALEGPRAAAFGEASGASGASATGATVDIVGLDASDELEIDGQALAGARRAALVPGLHHVRVLRGGRPVFAAFHELAAEQAQLALQVPELRPCSYDDLRSVNREAMAQGGSPPAGVACRRWALARPEPGGVGVALCKGASCGPFVHWQRRAEPGPFVPLVDRSRLPTWAGFAIAGAGAALATGLVLWQSGALERGPRAAATLEYGGLNP